MNSTCLKTCLQLSSQKDLSFIVTIASLLLTNQPTNMFRSKLHPTRSRILVIVASPPISFLDRNNDTLKKYSEYTGRCLPIDPECRKPRPNTLNPSCWYIRRVLPFVCAMCQPVPFSLVKMLTNAFVIFADFGLAGLSDAQWRAKHSQVGISLVLHCMSSRLRAALTSPSFRRILARSIGRSFLIHLRCKGVVSQRWAKL